MDRRDGFQARADAPLHRSLQRLNLFREQSLVRNYGDAIVVIEFLISAGIAEGDAGHDFVHRLRRLLVDERQSRRQEVPMVAGLVEAQTEVGSPTAPKLPLVLEERGIIE